MASLFKNKKVKLVAAISVAIFNLASVFTGVGAWFTSITKVKNSTNGFAITSTDGIQIMTGVEIYGWDDTNDRPEVTVDNFVLGEYDSYIPRKITYARRIIHLKIKYPGGINADNAFLKIAIDYTGAYKKNNKIEGYISNLVEFKYIDNKNYNISVNSDASTRTQAEITATYNALVTAFDSVTTYDTFVNISSKAKAGIVNKTAIPLAKTTDPTFVTDLFIQCNYNTVLTNDYLESIGFDLTSFNEEDPTSAQSFDPDISKIVLSVGKPTE